MRYLQGNRRIRFAASLLVLVFGAAALTAGGVSAGAAKKSVIVLGVIGTDSGQFSPAFVSQGQTAEAWAADVNARGGLNGHQVKLIRGDDGGSPATALAVAKKMVTQDHIVAAFAEHSLSSGPVLATYFQSVNVPVIGEGPADPVSDTNPNVFTPVSSSHAIPRGYLDSLIALDPLEKKIAVLYCAEAPACAAEKDEVSQYAQAKGLTVTYQGQVSLAAPDFTTSLLAARASGAQALVNIVDSRSTLRMFSNAKAQGWDPVFVGNPSQYQSSFQPGSDVPSRFIGQATSAAFATAPSFARYRAAMAKYAAGVQLTNGGASIFVAGRLLEEAAKSFGSTVKSKDILNGIYGLKKTTLGGMVPPITFNKGQHVNVNRCIVPLAWSTARNSWFAPLGPQHFVCSPPVTS